MSEIPRVRRQSPRALFSREDTEFTPWLERHIDRLSEVLGLSLTVIERERETPTGFSIDLFVEDQDSGEEGVIECQLESTDHDHLGKLLTYSTAYETELVIWLVSDARYEHEKAIDWLNESTKKLFYLVQIEAIEVGDELSLLFTPLATPSPEVKSVGESKREPNEREQKQERFWTELLERTPADFTLFDTIAPKQQGYITKGSGVAGVRYCYRIRNDWSDAGFYIDTGDADLNFQIFDDLYAQRDEIEAEIEYDVDWHRLEESRACRITIPIDSSGLTDEAQWPGLQDEMIDAMEQFHSVFGRKLQELAI